MISRLLLLEIVFATLLSAVAACGVYTGCTGCPSNYGAAATLDAGAG